MITQIYEAKSFDEARELVLAGVDFIGILVSHNNFPDVLNIDEAKKVLKGITGESKKVILPFSNNSEDISEIIKKTNPDIVHLAADPLDFSPGQLKLLKNKFAKVKFMRTIPVTDEKSIELAKKYDRIADFLLLDSRNSKNNQIGVTGETHDWNISRKIVESVSIPVILAGGIGAENVKEAILKVKPFGVDSKTKTDNALDGGKDIDKVKEFVRLAKNAAID